jgi:hypothetical protein
MLPLIVVNFPLIAASVVSFLFFYTSYLFIYSFLVDLTWLHLNALLLSDYPDLPIRKSHNLDIGFVYIFLQNLEIIPIWTTFFPDF